MVNVHPILLPWALLLVGASLAHADPVVEPRPVVAPVTDVPAMETSESLGPGAAPATTPAAPPQAASVEPLTTDESNQVADIIRDAVPAEDLSFSLIGPSWGQQVADRALTGLGVFLVLVVLLIWAYFREWKMSSPRWWPWRTTW